MRRSLLDMPDIQHIMMNHTVIVWGSVENLCRKSVQSYNNEKMKGKKQDQTTEYFDPEDIVESSPVPENTEEEVDNETTHTFIKTEVDVDPFIPETNVYSYEETPVKNLEDTPPEISRTPESTVVLTHTYDGPPAKIFKDTKEEEFKRIPELNVDLINANEDPLTKKIAPPEDSKRNLDSPIALTNLVDLKTNQKTTEFDVFGCSVAAQLNNMPFENALELQLEVQQVITKYRLKMYRKSIQSTSQTTSNIL